MPELGFFPVTCGLTWGRLRSSRLPFILALAFPVFIVWLGLTASEKNAMSTFLLFFPHIFLFLAQDMVKSDIDGGALENVLFLQGRFRDYLWQKNFFIIALGTAYSTALFILLAVWQALSGGFGRSMIVGFAVGLLVGCYYTAAAGLLSYFLRAGSNTVLFIVLQAAAFFTLLFTSAGRSGLLFSIADGRFPDLRTRIVIRGLTAVFPNLAVLEQLRSLWWEVLAGTALFLIAQRCLASRLELEQK